MWRQFLIADVHSLGFSVRTKYFFFSCRGKRACSSACKTVGSGSLTYNGSLDKRPTSEPRGEISHNNKGECPVQNTFAPIETISLDLLYSQPFSPTNILKNRGFIHICHVVFA